MVLTIGAALLVFTPKNIDLPFETIASNASQEPESFIPPYSYVPLAYQPPDPVGEQQSSSIDAVDLVRNPGSVPGFVTPTESANSQGNETGRSTEIVINVTQPTTVAVPTTPPAGRAANESTATSRPAQTTSAPAQTTTSPSQTASTPTASTPAKTTTTPAQTASTPAKTTTTPAQTASTPAKTTTTPAQTASRPAQTAPTQTTTVALTQPVSTAQTRAIDDFWVQTGAFSTVASAEGVKETLATKGITSIIENGNIDGKSLFRVRVGPYTSRNEANYWLALIKSIDGFEDSQVRTTENLR
ncbi:MAG: SPOR domain-containing protein [Treponema sp.]|nr:SPOR domain-containing protein [Treponema sp.]